LRFVREKYLGEHEKYSGTKGKYLGENEKYSGETHAFMRKFKIMNPFLY
jgi:hypothetical protein